MSIVSAARSIAGPALLRVQTREILSFIVALSEQDAIKLSDDLRRVLEDPTLREPTGENVTVMQAQP